MIISDLEHREIIDPSRGKDNLRQISGRGFVFTFATGEINASGSSVAVTKIQTKAYSFQALPLLF